MTDISSEISHNWASSNARSRISRRYRRDRWLRNTGVGAIVVAMGLLGILLTSLAFTGYVAFTTTKVKLEVFLDPAKVDRNEPGKASYRNLVREAFLANFPELKKRKNKREAIKILSSGAQYILRDKVMDEPELVGQTISVLLPLSDPFDQLYKGVVPRRINALARNRIASFESLKQRGLISVENGSSYLSLAIVVGPAILKNPKRGPLKKIMRRAFAELFSGETGRVNYKILSRDAVKILQARIRKDVNFAGDKLQVKLPISPIYDALNRTGKAEKLNPRFKSEKVLDLFDALVTRGMIASPFSWELFVNSDSRFPELAGLAGAFSGSLLALLVCFLISFPVGISAAVYLEEFAPKNKFSDFIEVNINNLAAVPSVVFGLLGLAVFIGFLGMPRSVPLVGGLVLALMTLPTIIVSTRAALKSVPPSIREAALGVGASKHEVVLHHVLPLAMPGILTGTIIGLAQALGETAPLLLIGMNAFIPSIENVGLLDPATALPTQIFTWGDSPERGFVSRTSAAILVLIGFLVTMNLLAIYLRQKFETKW